MADERTMIRRQIAEVVDAFFKSQLSLRGHDWSPLGDDSISPDQIDGPLQRAVDETTRKRVHDAMNSLAAELASSQGDRMVEMATNMDQDDRPVSQAAFESVAREMFAEGATWAHILTLMSFAVECAYHVGVMRGRQEVVDQCRRWLIEFLTTWQQPDIVNWIIDHGGLEGVVAFSATRADLGPAQEKWGSRLLMAAGGALGVALAFAFVRF